MSGWEVDLNVVKRQSERALMTAWKTLVFHPSQSQDDNDQSTGSWVVFSIRYEQKMSLATVEVLIL